MTRLRPGQANVSGLDRLARGRPRRQPAGAHARPCVLGVAAYARARERAPACSSSGPASRCSASRCSASRAGRARALLAALLLVGSAPLARADDPPAGELARSAEALAARWAAVREAVEAELGAPFAPPPRFVPATREEVERVLAAEDEGFLAGREGGPRGEALADACLARARLASSSCLAKLDVTAGHVVVAGEAFRALASVAPELAGVAAGPFLDVVLIHEAVHVWQDRRFGVKAFVGAPPTEGALRARRAVLEGHAQHVTRRVAATLGLEASFELLVRCSAELPSTAAGSSPEVKELVAAATLVHVDGERFVAAVLERLGREAGLARLFSAPPSSPDVVRDPDAYLGLAVDLAAVLREARPELPAGWRRQLVPVPADLLRPILERAGPDAVPWLEHGFREAMAAAATDPQVPGRQVTLSLIRCASPEAALKLLELELAVARAYDEELRRPGAGALLLRAEYGDAEVAGHRGHYVDKAVKVDATVVLRTLAVARGEFVVEVLVVRHPALDKAQLQAIARAALDLLPEPR